MDPEWLLRIVLFGIVHWILAGVLLHDLASRQRVFGRRKPVGNSHTDNSLLRLTTVLAVSHPNFLSG